MTKPEVIDALRLLKKNGKLNPPNVVDAARDPESPLHDEFEWDDGKAAHQHRLDQARHLIANVRIINPETKKEEPVFVSLMTDRKLGGYREVEDVLNNDELRQDLLRTIAGELRGMQSRFDRWQEIIGQELALIGTTADSIEQSAAKPKPKKSGRKLQVA